LIKPGVKRLLALVVGWGFIALGIVGLFLPILQGVLFLLIGLSFFLPNMCGHITSLPECCGAFPSCTGWQSGPRTERRR